jgi:hypothetical protein
MIDNLNNDLSADFTKEDRKDLFKHQIIESAKSIEQCKKKQWYVLLVGIILNFSIFFVADKSIVVIFSFNMFKLFFLLICCILICIFGFTLINDLLDTIEKQRTQIYYLNQWLFGHLPENWQKAIVNEKLEYDKDRRFAGIMNTILILCAILSFMILCALIANSIKLYFLLPRR